jgi:hypothetical protein
MPRNKIVHLIWPLLLIYLVYLLSKLVWLDSLSSFANDSVHYLVMARHFSPWISESSAIATAWALQDFPPFFPWLLALSGAAHSLLYAHLLVAGLGLSSLYFYYLLSNRWLNNRGWAIFPPLILSLSPGFLLGLQGILSESLYLLLIPVFMLVYTPTEKKSTAQIILAGTLLAAILLTRTVGIALCLAILAQGFFSSISRKKIQFQSILIVAISLCVYLLLMAIWGPEKESHYVDVLIQYLTGKESFGPGAVSSFYSSYVSQLANLGSSFYSSYVSQLANLLDAWTSFWLIYWGTDIYSANYYVIMLLLLTSMSGLFIRLVKNKYDAWYALFYILILLLWPHPGQMFRLIFPIMPILLIYASYAIKKLIDTQKNNKKDLLSPVFFLIVLTAIIPSHVFLHARASIASERQMVPVYQFFLRTDLAVATKHLLLQNQMLRDFERIKDFVSADEKVMYFLPSYVAILSDKPAEKASSPVERMNYRQTARESGARYIFLTQLHPRNSLLSYRGLQGRENLKGWTQQLWCSQLKDGDLASCLYRVIRPLDLAGKG